MTILLWVFGVLGFYARGEPSLYDPLKVDFLTVSGTSFNQAVNRYRGEDMSQAVLLYTRHKGPEKTFVNEVFQPLSAELRHVVRFSAIDCSEIPKVCADVDPTQSYKETGYSVVRLPPLPRPADVLDLSRGKDYIKKALLSVIPTHNVIKLSDDNFGSLVRSEKNIPKIVIITKKERAPTFFYAFANAMKDRISFAHWYVKDAETEAVARKKFRLEGSLPMLITTKGKSKEVYRGDLKNQTQVYDWINIRSETFARGGGVDDTNALLNKKPWRDEKVPELTKLSASEVCFQFDGVCGIFSTAGVPTDVEMKQFEVLADALSTGEKGDKRVKFSWFSREAESAVLDFFDQDGTVGVQFALLNASKKVRVSKSVEGEAVVVTNEIVKLRTGDQRFKIKGKLPVFEQRGSKLVDAENSDEL